MEAKEIQMEKEAVKAENTYITVINVMSEEEAIKLVSEFSEDVIIKKVIDHVRKNGSGGLAGAIARELSY